MENSPLLQLQQRFSQFIRADKYSVENMKAVGILNQPPVSVQKRGGIYQNAYFQRIEESLEDDFPKISQILGQNLFSQLIKEYLKEYPSSYWSLAEVGKNLSLFISHSSWGTQYQYLSDLAKFEWLKVLANFALIPEKFNFSSILNIEADKQQDVILQLDSSVYLFESSWVLHEESIPFKQATNSIRELYVIYQKEGEVYHRELNQLQWSILSKISQGLSIGKIMDSLCKVQGINGNMITDLFANFVSECIITQLKL